MQGQSKLREYIIKYFLITIVCVSLVENIITYIINQWIFPHIEQIFIKGESAARLTLSDVIVFLIMILVQALLSLIGKVFPVEIQNLLQELSMKLQSSLVGAFPRIGKRIMWVHTNNQRIFQYIVIIFGILIIYLIPYAIGTYVFSKTVMKRVRQMEEEQDNERKEFDRKRNLMLSDIAHDLRTPMTTINGYAKALNDGMIADPQKQREYLDIIQIKSKRMNDLIELLFEYVKIDSAGFKLEKEDTNICELLRENAALMYTDIEDAGMEFEVDIPEEEIYVSLDKIQFSRLITNLLVNAIRHNKANTAIKLELKKYPGMIKIDIADNGIKIPKEMEERIFDPFSKGDKSRANSGGTGLGLSIAKKVVNLHGWEIYINNKYTGYTKAFEINIPILEAAAD